MPVANVTAVSENTLIHPGVGQDPVYVDVTVTTPVVSWVDGAAVVMKQGSCPADHKDGIVLGAVATGAGKHALYGAQVPEAGSWCVAAFTMDSSLRYAPAGGTVSFVYTHRPRRHRPAGARRSSAATCTSRGTGPRRRRVTR